MKRFIGAAVCAVFALTAFVGCGSKKSEINAADWNSDYESAVEYAKKNSKELMVLFTGEDPLTKEFKENVTDKDEFKSTYSEKYVLVNIEVPESYAPNSENEKGISKEEKAARIAARDLLKKNLPVLMEFQVMGSPSVYIETADKFILTLIPCYKIDSVEAFNDAMESNEETCSRMKELIANTTATKGVDRAAAIYALLEETRVPNSTVMELAKQIPSLDKKNETGVVGKYKFRMLLGEADKAFGRKMDFDKAVKVLAAGEKDKVYSAEDKQNIAFQIGNVYAKKMQYLGFNDKDFEAMKQAFTRSRDYAPESGAAEQCSKILEQLDAMMAQKNAEEAAEKEEAAKVADEAAVTAESVEESASEEDGPKANAAAIANE